MRFPSGVFTLSNSPREASETPPDLPLDCPTRAGFSFGQCEPAPGNSLASGSPTSRKVLLEVPVRPPNATPPAVAREGEIGLNAL
jgi:hypothetical protein